MNINNPMRQRRFAFGIFFVSGLLAFLLVASFGFEWGTAYGQTAGTANTPVVSTSGPGVTGNAGKTGETPVTVLVGSGEATGKPTLPTPGIATGSGMSSGNPAAVDGENKNPQSTNGEGLLPGLPRAGKPFEAGNASRPDILQVLALVSLGVLMSGSMVALIKKARDS
jgi:hypothetical protein